MAEQTDQALTQEARQNTQDYNATTSTGDERLRGGTQGGEVARTMSGVQPQGTPDVSASGGVHVPVPAEAKLGGDVRPGEHSLAGGKSPDDVQRFLEGVTFPAKKDTIVRVASSNGAPPEIVRCLSDLTSTDYASFDEVIRDYARLPEQDDLGSSRDDIGPGGRRV